MWETRIVEIRERVKESLEDLSFEKLNEKPSPGEWSIAQIVLHLAGAETRFLTLAIESAKLKSVTTRSTPVDLSVFDDESTKLKAPIEPSSDPMNMVDLMNALDKSRTLTLHLLDQYTKEDLNDRSMHHHRFGEMPIWQVFELLGKHEQRHLLQIEDVKKRIG
ncbi:DinB family protein [Rossellomorea arthrocnemi]|jgi:uncharacterized damage-inducible protein DinB|uniref:DinB family protein n=1 Tax=Rossellomorea arthrocnemi TaxID=2769542 RepID=UPI001918E332|nr:DinB family protein [Rossellomorea arthrocnemi]